MTENHSAHDKFVVVQRLDGKLLKYPINARRSSGVAGPVPADDAPVKPEGDLGSSAPLSAPQGSVARGAGRQGGRTAPRLTFEDLDVILRTEAAEICLLLILERGPRPVAEVKKLIRGVGIHESIFRRARRELQIKTWKSSFQGPWMWQLHGPSLARARAIAPRRQAARIN